MATKLFQKKEGGEQKLLGGEASIVSDDSS
jgi:hypothetical protein